MKITGRQLPAGLRAFVRNRESGLVLAAIVIGIASGGLVALMGWTVQQMHEILFNLPDGQRLSATFHIPRWRALLVPIAGGLILTAFSRYSRRMSGRLADAIEANALFGGRLSLTGSLLVTVQTVLSCGTGASVGLEAGYAQICAAVASRLGLRSRPGAETSGSSSPAGPRAPSRRPSGRRSPAPSTGSRWFSAPTRCRPWRRSPRARWWRA